MRKTILRDSKTGLLLKWKRPVNHREITKAAKDSVDRLIAAFADKSGQTLI